MPQYNNTAEARNDGRDNSELNELARMMPDPAEDELFDDGTSADRFCTLPGGHSAICHVKLLSLYMQVSTHEGMHQLSKQ